MQGAKSTATASDRRKRGRRRLPTLVLLGLFVMPLVMGAAAIEDAENAARAQQQMVGGGCGGMDPSQVQQRTRNLGLPARIAGFDVVQTDIPPEALAAYCSAAAEYEVDWTLLAGVGWIECKHGRATLDGCKPGTVNGAGARGPMQHVGQWWDKRSGEAANRDPHLRTRPIPEGREDTPNGGFGTDGDGDRWADPWTWKDATYGAAREIRHYYERLRSWDRAVEGYNAGPGNSASAYLEAVKAVAEKYREKTADLGSAAIPTSADCRVDGSSTPASMARITSRMRRVMTALVECFGRGRYGYGCWRAGSWGEHPLGRACDFMMAPLGSRPDAFHLEQGWRMSNMLVQQADAWGIKYVIWQDQIWSKSRRSEGWREYGNPSSCSGGNTCDHNDHVHVSVDP